MQIDLKASGPGGLKSSDMADEGLATALPTGSAVLEQLFSSTLPKLCLGRIALGRNSSLYSLKVPLISTLELKTMVHT